MKQIYVESYFKGYRKYLNYSLLKSHSQEEIISKRLKIIEFFDKYGSIPTKEAFGVSRSTVYLWKSKLKENKGRLTALAPLSRTPKKKRTRQTNTLIIKFIKDYRNSHPGVSKETIKYQLDEYLSPMDIPSISESTIGRIIKDLKQKGQIKSYLKLSLSARTGRLIERKKPVVKKLRRKGYRPKEAGDLIQIDSIFVFANGLKRYILSAIDISTGFGFAFAYNSLSSINAVDFIKKLKEVAPFDIKRIQTDNGSEFSGHFKDYIKKYGIIHYHNYPRYPKGNAYVERFNRTVKEQFVRWHKDSLFNLEIFNKELMGYLVWYNTEKTHTRLKMPPLKYWLDSLYLSFKKSNMLWTSTGA